MATVIGILCLIKTGEVEKARTNGNVYLGLGGREFGLNSGDDDDFEWADSPEFVLGKDFDPASVLTKRQVVQPKWNDPAIGYPLDMDLVDDFPVYIRFEPQDSDDEWYLEHAQARARSDDGRTFTYTPSKGFAFLWLSDDSGKILYLAKQVRG